jgi:hypothetical protein
MVVGTFKYLLIALVVFTEPHKNFLRSLFGEGFYITKEIRTF